MPAFPRDDLADAVELAGDFWRSHSGARIFLTGGTGLIGRWLIEVVQAANDMVDSRMEIVALVRDESSARARLPNFERSDLRLIPGDVRTFAGQTGQFDLCIHAAAQIGSGKSGDALEVFDTIVTGTRRVSDLAYRARAKRLLLTSSGAVYGEQPPLMEKVREDYQGAPLLRVEAAYGNAKRAAEWIAAAAATDSAAGFTATIARIFAVVGPGVPLNRQFALGNFIRDAVDGRPIHVISDGRSVRSYLYLSDVCVWLLRILGYGQNGEAYNVGSEREVSIMRLAEMIGATVGIEGIERTYSTTDASTPPRYVPDTSKAQRYLGVQETVPLETALVKTIEWTRLADE